MTETRDLDDVRRPRCPALEDGDGGTSFIDFDPGFVHSRCGDLGVAEPAETSEIEVGQPSAPRPDYDGIRGCRSHQLRTASRRTRTPRQVRDRCPWHARHA